MLLTTELRIGNYIYDTTDECLPVTVIRKNKVKVKGYNEYVFIDDCNPVEITPKILAQLNLLCNGNLLHIVSNMYFEINESQLWLVSGYGNFTFISDLLYLHEVQNIYYYLSKKELQIAL